MSTGALDPIQLPAAMPAETVPARRTSDIACRLLDLVVALPALILFSPVLLVIAAVVRAESPGPSFFRQQRVGRSLKPFTIYKFRTMAAGASADRHREFVQSLIAGAQPEEVQGRPLFKLTADDRITRVGRFLRRSSLDELPQLLNVLRGDMSLVGPRPPIPYEVERYPPSWFRRFEVKPGITGLWQVSGRCELTLEEMIDLDVTYVERRSFHLNLWILLRTLPAMLTSRGAA